MLTKRRLHEIIFEADTPAGKWFDIILLWMIIFSVLTVMVDSVDFIHDRHEQTLLYLEWTFTIFFTIEYILRIYITQRPMRYVLSFFGIIDLLSILPTYLSLIVAGSHYLIVIRALRLMRVFRILKLVKFSREGLYILSAMRRSMHRITIFLAFVVTLVIILGSLMYLIEGASNDSFSSIPRSVYWAIVTLTTVGYGDITPSTNVGQFLAAIIMLLGYAIIAVPTGITAAEMTRELIQPTTNSRNCYQCHAEDHSDDARYCHHCGHTLNEAD